MPDGDVHRSHMRTRAQDPSDDLVPVPQRRPTASGCRWGVVRAAQSGLGAAYGRHIEQNAHVRGDAESARVSQPLPVEHQHVRQDGEALKRRQHGGCLPERQQPRHVGEQHRRLGLRPVDHLQAGQREHNYACMSDLTAMWQSDIDPRHRARRHGRIRSRPYLTREATLYGRRLPRGNVPLVSQVSTHSEVLRHCRGAGTGGPDGPGAVGRPGRAHVTSRRQSCLRRTDWAHSDRHSSHCARHCRSRGIGSDMCGSAPVRG